MLAFLVIIGFMLAVLAHVKLFITNRALVSIYDALSAQISDRAARDAAQQRDVELVVGPEVLPNPPNFVDAVVLQWFYALNDKFRARVFHDVAGATKLQPNGLSDLYNAAYGIQNVERSMSFQNLLRHINAQQYAVIKQAVENAIADQNTVPAAPAVEPVVPAVPAAPTVEPVVPTVEPVVPAVEPVVPAVPVVEIPELPTEAKKKRTSKARGKSVELAAFDVSHGSQMPTRIDGT